MNILLHACCGPCASHCLLALREKGHDVALFFSNSNIWPQDEWERRLEAAQKLANATGTELIVDPPDHEAWKKEVASGHEQEPECGERCRLCYRFSLARTFAEMQKRGFDAFTTSLTVAPHKPSSVVFSAGKEVSAEHFLEENFKKKEGFLRSTRLAAQYGLYRQSYCGCEYSLRKS